MKNKEEENLRKLISRLSKSSHAPLRLHTDLNAYRLAYKVFFPFAWAASFPEEQYPVAPSTIAEFNQRIEIGNTYFLPGKWETIKAKYLQDKHIKELFADFNLPFNNNSSLNQLYRKLGKLPIKFQRNIRSEVEVLNKILGFLLKGNSTLKFSPLEANSLNAYQENSDKIIPWREKQLEEYLKFYQKLNQQDEVKQPQLPLISFDASEDWYILKSSQLGAYHFFLISKDQSIENLLELEKLSFIKI